MSQNVVWYHLPVKSCHLCNQLCIEPVTSQMTPFQSMISVSGAQMDQIVDDKN